MAEQPTAAASNKGGRQPRTKCSAFENHMEEISSQEVLRLSVASVSSVAARTTFQKHCAACADES